MHPCNHVSYSQVAPNIVSYTAAFTALDKGDDRGYPLQLHADELDGDELQDVELVNTTDDTTTSSSSSSISSIGSSDELSRGEVGLTLLATMQAEGHTPSLYCYSGLCTARNIGYSIMVQHLDDCCLACSSSSMFNTSRVLCNYTHTIELSFGVIVAVLMCIIPEV
jgi:hypothetical protein